MALPPESEASLPDSEPAVPLARNLDMLDTPSQGALSPTLSGPGDGNMFPEGEEELAIKSLTGIVRDQSELERDITHRANLELMEAEDQKDRHRIEKLKASRVKLADSLGRLQSLDSRPRAVHSTQQEIAMLNAHIVAIDKEIDDFKARIENRHQENVKGITASSGTQRFPHESQREFLIRTGKITPFSKVGGARPEGVWGELANAIMDAEDEAIAKDIEHEYGDGLRSHQNLRRPGFSEPLNPAPSAAQTEFSLRPRKRRRQQQSTDRDDDGARSSSSINTPESTFESEDSEGAALTAASRPGQKRKSSKLVGDAEEKVDFSALDDGNEAAYQKRLGDWVERRSQARRDLRNVHDERIDHDAEAEEEWFKPSPNEADHLLNNGSKIPGDIYHALFDYQKTGVQWFADLYDRQVGGILSDEMGLGKTVQVISFIAALHYNKKLDKPVIVVAPATVMQQWVKEFHRWWPPLRVSILHSSGSGMLNIRNEDRMKSDEYFTKDKADRPSKLSKAVRKVVDRVVHHGHVLLTTYAGLQTYGDLLIPVDWGYAVLDEGHKIKNPNAGVTVRCKELRTAHRIILSGTPMQNNVTELWSLFDFIYPMRLGTLDNFRNQFDIPIRMGGYANASTLDIMTAQKCAETLKDAIHEYLLRRTKADVAADLPKKSEHVIFCKLTRAQHNAYNAFLHTDEMNAIMSGRRQALYGIDYVRKISNHLDLVRPGMRDKPGYVWGSSSKSGKLPVVEGLLRLWKSYGHKSLLFSQGTQMLDIIESFTKRLGDIKYVRMDGKTPIKDRQALVDQFNRDPGLDLFLLTTKVGGLGVNLTGANRVIIFDPDWNPSTDMQARERAWRLGQKKDVAIYRLVTPGTIEEKMYQRQIYKQVLTNKVLDDPTQQAKVGLSDLQDLFTLGAYEDGTTETSEIFQENLGKAPSSGARTFVTPGADSVPIVVSRESGPPASIKRADDEAVELRGIAGVVGLEDYREGAEAKTPAGEEDRLLQSLFAQPGVHSTLEHDKIVNNRPQADSRMLREEAYSVAAAAKAHLERAEEAARNVPIGTVTWTGEVGEAGRPNLRRGRVGPGSGEILARVSGRQGIRDAGRAASPRTATPDRSQGDWEKMIREFIGRHGGKVASKVLVDHFGQFCVTTQQSSVFYTALGEVAVMNKKGSRMRAIWALKA